MAEGPNRVTPRLVVSDGAGAIDFYVRAFGAEEAGERFVGSEGELIHAELRLGGGAVMITQDSDPDAAARSPERLGGYPSAIMAT